MRSSIRNSVSLLCSIAIIGCFCKTVDAQLIEVSINAVAGQDSTNINLSSATAVSQSASVANPGVASFGSAFADYGTLRAVSDSTSNFDGIQDPLLSSGSVLTSWTDTLRFTSSLPNNTQVQLRMIFDVDGSLTATGAGQGGNLNLAEVTGVFSASDGLSTAAVHYEGNTNNGFSSQGGSALFTTQTGASVQLEGQLDLFTRSFANPTFPDAQAIASYGNTARFYLEVLTPGVDVISSSGHNYATPVPEPSSSVLVGSLLVAGSGLLLHRMRRASRGQRAN